MQILRPKMLLVLSEFINRFVLGCDLGNVHWAVGYACIIIYIYMLLNVVIQVYEQTLVRACCTTDIIVRYFNKSLGNCKQKSKQLGTLHKNKVKLNSLSPLCIWLNRLLKCAIIELRNGCSNQEVKEDIGASYADMELARNSLCVVRIFNQFKGCNFPTF